ncbi:MAG: hypothetical protein OEZ13_04590 [Spirochaetia bacterium]|nr:hypothetical protein [Spirochaetia bacterium]
MYTKQGRFQKTKLVFFMVAILIPAVLTAQQAQTKKETAQKKTEAKSGQKKGEKALEEEKRAGTYLDILHAKQNVLKLKEENFHSIKRIKAMVANFGDGSEKSKFDQIQSNYVQGMKEMYQRQYLESNITLERNKEDLDTLMEGLTKRYKERASEILERCAGELVAAELGEGQDIADRTNVNLGKIIDKTKGHLIIAYLQFDEGKSFEYEKRYEEALVHYRLAKEHGIHILIRLKLTEDEKNQVRSEFRRDLTDSNNMVSGG